MGNWVRISTAKALGIVWRERTNKKKNTKKHKKQTQLPNHYICGCFCNQAAIVVMRHFSSSSLESCTFAVLIRPSRSRSVLVIIANPGTKPFFPCSQACKNHPLPDQRAEQPVVSSATTLEAAALSQPSSWHDWVDWGLVIARKVEYIDT